ncbi:hypothetical protein PAMP_021452 [Pampus punctatissimus]
MMLCFHCQRLTGNNHPATWTQQRSSLVSREEKEKRQEWFQDCITFYCMGGVAFVILPLKHQTLNPLTDFIISSVLFSSFIRLGSMPRPKPKGRQRKSKQTGQYNTDGQRDRLTASA